MKERIFQRPRFSTDPDTGESIFLPIVYEYFAQEAINGKPYDWAEASLDPYEGNALLDVRERARQAFERAKNEGA